jgi:hypothetical protein
MILVMLACLVLVAAPQRLVAQSVRLVEGAPSVSSASLPGPRYGTVWPALHRAEPTWVQGDPHPLSPSLATGASLLLPGTGQLLLGKGRWVLFASLELVGWLVHLGQRRDGHRLRTEYIDVAWMVARYGDPQLGREGDFEYYETLGSWSRSGNWDADRARAGVQPEDDADTFNGATWELARDIFLPLGAGEGHPSFAKALGYYEDRAYPPGLLWDWTGKEASLDQYRNLIKRSDEALRTASVVLGAVVANHLLSAVDAFVSSHAPVAGSVSASAVLRAHAHGPAFEWRLEIRP